MTCLSPGSTHLGTRYCYAMRPRATSPTNQTHTAHFFRGFKICACLISLILACSVIPTATSNSLLDPAPGSYTLPRQAAVRGGDGSAAYHNNIINNRRRSRSIAREQGARSAAGAVGYDGVGTPIPGGNASGSSGQLLEDTRDLPEAVEVSGADLATRGTVHLDGVYLREWDVNGAPHFKKRSKRGSRTPSIHLFFTGNEWMLHHDVETDLDINHCLAYSEVPELNPLRTTRRWAVRVGQAWVRRPHMRIAETSADAETTWKSKDAQAGAGAASATGSYGQTRRTGPDGAAKSAANTAMNEQDATLTKQLMPLYLVFILDAIGLGVALPVLPFYVMGLEATALQLAIVVSSNYIAQTFGCVLTGNMSDIVGRKPVVICCLLGTVASHIMVARSKNLKGVAWGRIIGGVTGGLTPIAQAAVADVVPVQSLPKFLGRIQACVGLGFVMGPLTMTVLHRLLKVSTADTFFAAAVFPVLALLYALFRMPETKSGETGISQLWRRSAAAVSSKAAATAAGSFGGKGSHALHARDRANGSSRRRKRRVRDSRDVRRGSGQEEWHAAIDAERAREVLPGQIDSAVPRAEGEVDGNVGVGVAGVGGEHVAGVEGFGGAPAVVSGSAAVWEEGAAPELIPRAVMLLVGNGFLLMYAFSIETIYAMFLKDNFGYGESVLSMVFALNGLAVGALQLLGMRHLVKLLGKHMMLILGNLFLALGMVGMALSRQPFLHFALFTVHIMGYSLADTALVALISRYASPATQGRSMGLNQAAQSLSRVVSPVVAGVLYEWSKSRDKLPLGSLPYLVGSAFPLVGIAVPFWLYLRSVEAKKRRGVYARGGCLADRGLSSSEQDARKSVDHSDTHEKKRVF